MKRTVYRDRKTGRIVSRKKWTRSRAHGGTRYVRHVEHWKKSKRKTPSRVEPREPQSEQEEYTINVRYKHRAAAAVEVQVSAQGPAGASRRDVLEAMGEKLAHSGRDPLGWTIKGTLWRKGSKRFEGKDETQWQNLNWLWPHAKKST